MFITHRSFSIILAHLLLFFFVGHPSSALIQVSLNTTTNYSPDNLQPNFRCFSFVSIRFGSHSVAYVNMSGKTHTKIIF